MRLLCTTASIDLFIANVEQMCKKEVCSASPLVCAVKLERWETVVAWSCVFGHVNVYVLNANEFLGDSKVSLGPS